MTGRPIAGAVDQGTTGTKAVLLLDDGRVEVVASLRHSQFYPQPGWVEHDARELLDHVQQAVDALGAVPVMGLANQGETVVAWDAHSGEPIYNAIVWQDSRTNAVVDRFKADGREAIVLERAGLPLDPYFSATKLRWLIDNAPGARQLLAAGRLRLGTSDAFYLDRLTGVYATDVTTASRTSLMNLEKGCWDETLCDLFGIPPEALPRILPTAGDFGCLRSGDRKIAVRSSVVDQQASLYGHGCLDKSQMKVTCGTSAVAIMNTGEMPLGRPSEGILSTVAWDIGGRPRQFAVDGCVYNAASAVEWARRIRLFDDGTVLDHGGPLAVESGLVFVPALSGLGGPYWDRSAAGLWIGMDLATSREDLCRSVLEGVAFRVAQLIERLMEIGGRPTEIPLDGGLSNNAYFCQVLSDATAIDILVPSMKEMTAYGAAGLALAGLGISVPATPVSTPLKRYTPRGHSRALKECFAAAVERSRNWR